MMNFGESYKCALVWQTLRFKYRDMRKPLLVHAWNLCSSVPSQEGSSLISLTGSKVIANNATLYLNIENDVAYLHLVETYVVFNIASFNSHTQG
jgi:hypothetical protein